MKTDVTYKIMKYSLVCITHYKSQDLTYLEEENIFRHLIFYYNFKLLTMNCKYGCSLVTKKDSIKYLHRKFKRKLRGKMATQNVVLLTLNMSILECF